MLDHCRPEGCQILKMPIERAFCDAQFAAEEIDPDRLRSGTGQQLEGGLDPVYRTDRARVPPIAAVAADERAKKGRIAGLFRLVPERAIICSWRSG
jgi:hypothetical protein